MADNKAGSMTEGRVPGPTRPSAHSEYLPSLEGLRGVFAVGVVAVHAAIYTGIMAAGWNNSTHSSWWSYLLQPFGVAVPFFSVMAGMLLYRQFVGMAMVGKRLPSVRAYFWRRALRVLPLYWFVVAFAIAFCNPEKTWWDFVRTMSFLQIYQGNEWHTADLPYGLVPTWSLASEAVFYVLLPPMAIGLAWLAARFGGTDVAKRAKVTLLALSSLVALNLVWVVYVHLDSTGEWPLQWYWLPALIGYFAAGMALAVVAEWMLADPADAPAFIKWARANPGRLWLIVAVTFAMLGVPQIVGRDPHTYYPNVLNGVLLFLIQLVCAGALVLAIMAGRRPSRFLSHPVMIVAGRLSYGVYLWHTVVLVTYYFAQDKELGTGNYLFVMLLTLVLSFLLAGLTHVAIERPFQKLRPKLGRAPARYADPADDVSTPTLNGPATAEAAAV